MNFWWSKKIQAAEELPAKEPGDDIILERFMRGQNRVEIDANAIFREGTPAASRGRLDPRSSTWCFVRAWAEDMLAKAREKNDSANKDFTQTSVLRGEIRMLKALIGLPNPKKGLLMTDEEDV